MKIQLCKTKWKVAGEEANLSCGAHLEKAIAVLLHCMEMPLHCN